MKNNRKFLLFIPLLFLIVLILGYLNLYKYYKIKDSTHFQRLSFQAGQKTEDLLFDNTAHRWLSKSRKKIPYVSGIAKGTGILFEGSGSLTLTPGLSGEKGVFFRVDAGSHNREKISLSVSIERDNEVIYRANMQSKKKGRINYSFSKIFNFSGADRIKINSHGTGALVAGDAFVYDLIAREKRKYVFVIALDTLRWDKIGFAVKGIDLTPNLNRFKKDAVNFANAYAQSSWTLPSFTSFFTGLYEFNHQIIRHRVLDAAKPFLVENVSQKYMTASINGGTWLTGKIGNSRGFDSYRVGSGAREIYASRTLFEKSTRFIDRSRVPGLFMFMHTYAIHAPYIPPEEFLFKLNEKPLFRARSNYSKKNQYKKNVPGQIKESMEELYQAEILAFDYYFGEFINYLKKEGIYDQSLIVFFSDHGEEFYEHLGWGHGHSLYNELIKVPLIIKFPGSKFKNLNIEDNVGIIDVLPTLLDYLDIEQKGKIDGISLMPLIRGSATPAAEGSAPAAPKRVMNREFLVSSVTGCSFFDQAPKRIAILFDHYKMICNFEISDRDKAFFREAGLPPEVPKFEIFDLENDPLETNNLYPARRELIKGLQKKLSEIIKKVRFNLQKKRTGKVELSDEELENLKALGYL